MFIFLMRSLPFSAVSISSSVIVMYSGSRHQILDRAGVPDIEMIVRKIQLRWAGHVARMSDDRIPKQCDLVKRNTTLFWSHVSKQSRRCIIPADTAGGATGREYIASMWKNHYANLFNCVDTVSDKESVLDTISRVTNVHDALCSDDVKSSIKALSANKACGHDNSVCRTSFIC